MQEEKGKSRGIFNMKGDDELCRFPSFFKLILSAGLCLRKLEIPRKFVENHGEKLSDLVYLITPTKAVWKVDVVRKDTRAWLQNGWAEFVKFYSICHGHFLVFRYRGYSHFEVIIFDMSASEIEYPTSSRTGSKRKRATGIPIAPASIKEDEIPKKGSNIPNLIVGRKCLLTVEEAKKIEAYNCEHPSFVTKIVPSHVEFKYNVNLPIEFVRKYLKDECGMFTFENVTGKTWPVRCMDTTKGKKKIVTFNSGWRAFAQDNKLQVGDICVFELIKQGESKMFKVNVLPVLREKVGNYPLVKLEVD